MGSKPRLVFVDDEEMTLKQFAWEFEDLFEIRTFSDPCQALGYLKEQASVDVIISDQRMPGLSGAEFLTEAKILCPESQRIITTAYSDIDKLILCVNQAEVSGYLEKPWDDQEFLAVVNKALAEKQDQCRFQQRLSIGVQRWADRILERRRSDLRFIARLCDHKHPHHLIGYFEELLLGLGFAHPVDWADTVLFDAPMEERFMLSFLKRAYGLSRNGQLKGHIDAQRAVSLVQTTLPLKLSGAGSISFEQLSIAVNLARLVHYLGPAGSGCVTIECRRGACRILVNSQSSFGDSLLSPVCDKSPTTVLLNALVFDSLAKTLSSGGRMELRCEQGLNGLVTFDRNF